jgi:hypothetical protein
LSFCRFLRYCRSVPGSHGESKQSCAGLSARGWALPAASPMVSSPQQCRLAVPACALRVAVTPPLIPRFGMPSSGPRNNSAHHIFRRCATDPQRTSVTLLIPSQTLFGQGAKHKQNVSARNPRMQAQNLYSDYLIILAQSASPPCIMRIRLHPRAAIVPLSCAAAAPAGV